MSVLLNGYRKRDGSAFVSAIKVTDENIFEVAKLCESKINKSSARPPFDNTFIINSERPDYDFGRSSKQTVYAGVWITFSGDGMSAYTNEEFCEQFTEASPDIYSVTIETEKTKEEVEHPDHYNQYEGLEIIDLCEQMNFNRGNAVKYIARAGFKNPDTEIQDLMKAKFYIEREIHRLEKRAGLAL